jgi:hypothetical protein
VGRGTVGGSACRRLPRRSTRRAQPRPPLRRRTRRTRTTRRAPHSPPPPPRRSPAYGRGLEPCRQPPAVRRGHGHERGSRRARGCLALDWGRGCSPRGSGRVTLAPRAGSPPALKACTIRAYTRWAGASSTMHAPRVCHAHAMYAPTCTRSSSTAAATSGWTPSRSACAVKKERSTSPRRVSPPSKSAYCSRPAEA